MGEQVGARFIWAYSSAGESARLISVRSVVRVHLSPYLDLAGHNSRKRGKAHLSPYPVGV